MATGRIILFPPEPFGRKPLRKLIFIVLSFPGENYENKWNKSPYVWVLKEPARSHPWY